MNQPGAIRSSDMVRFTGLESKDCVVKECKISLKVHNLLYTNASRTVKAVLPEFLVKTIEHIHHPHRTSTNVEGARFPRLPGSGSGGNLDESFREANLAPLGLGRECAWFWKIRDRRIEGTKERE